MNRSALMPVEEAIARLLEMAEAQRLQDSEPVLLSEARQRVLANDLLATMDLPPWPNSAMDGYALNVNDWHGEPLTVSQQIFAGRAPEALRPGTCVRIFTGAPVPSGANCVEMQENTQVLDDGRVSFKQPLAMGDNIRPQGQENRAGKYCCWPASDWGLSSWRSLRLRAAPMCTSCGGHGSPCSPRVMSWSIQERRSNPAVSTTATAPC